VDKFEEAALVEEVALVADVALVEEVALEEPALKELFFSFFFVSLFIVFDMFYRIKLLRVKIKVRGESHKNPIYRRIRRHYQHIYYCISCKTLESMNKGFYSVYLLCNQTIRGIIKEGNKRKKTGKKEKVK